MSTKHPLSHLDWLEAEAIHILREVAGQCANPVLLFSGGKDSLCILRLAEKAFRPGRFPFPLMHIDTGHNYQEVVNFRDQRAAELGERLIVRSVEDSMKRGTVVLKTPDEPRNKHQSVTLLEAIEEFGFDCCIGGARRDEDGAVAARRHAPPVVRRAHAFVGVLVARENQVDAVAAEERLEVPTDAVGRRRLAGLRVARVHHPVHREHDPRGAVGAVAPAGRVRRAQVVAQPVVLLGARGEVML